jgi:flagellar assembly protein FliH
MVNLDTENKIIIDIGSPVEDADKPDASEHDPRKHEKDAKRLAARITRKAELEAEEIVAKAVMEAHEKKAEIQKTAKAEATQLLAQSREDGYNAGMQTATAEGEKIKSEAMNLLEATKSECNAMKESLEPDIVNMIISITENLLGKITELNPAIIVNLVKQGFAAATISGNVTLYVSADDYDEVIERKDEIMAFTDGSVKLEITKDLSLSPMDCVIETPFGGIDCSLGQQFESIRTNLAYILNNK